MREQQEKRMRKRGKKLWKQTFGTVCMFLYFGVMLFLTLFAETIHENSLIKVEASFVKLETDSDGQTSCFLSEDICRNGKIYVLREEIRNGLERTVVREVPVRVIKQEGMQCRVSGEIQSWDKIIVWSSREIKDGDEVFVKVT